MISEQTKELISQARQQIIVDDLSSINKRFHRILSTDPTLFYQMADEFLSPFKRNNWILREHIFPPVESGLCRCGCGQKVTGRRKSWATEECTIYINQVIAILIGKSDFIRRLIEALYGQKCCKCYATWKTLSRPNENDWRTILGLDHILPVHQGGGGCWLSNYQLLCFVCHKEKGKLDRLK